MISKHKILNLFGDNVRKYRLKLGISQEELAVKACLHRTYIGMVERAEKNITLINIQKIANALEVKIEELMNEPLTFGSVCSGIEASRLSFNTLHFNQLWCSEIAEFPSKVLSFHYPTIPNIGDINLLPGLLLQNKVEAPDFLCGGTPCQAFSLAGWQNGLSDKRGQLTMKFIDVANAIDEVRKKENKKPSIILWENVEGVLNNETNAFGNFIAGLAGFNSEIIVPKWTKSGYLEGIKRNVAWRVLDAKYFGLAQQRKRLYVLAGGKEFRPDQVLFEYGRKNILKHFKSNDNHRIDDYTNNKVFFKNGFKFEFFRDYTDCLYSAYGSKWNGNSGAYNGSLFVAQNDRIRRFTPLECERLMGIPDNYTQVNGNSDVNRYQAIGNSWAVPVVNWIGNNIDRFITNKENSIIDWTKFVNKSNNNQNAHLFLLESITLINNSLYLNSSSIPNIPRYGRIEDVIQPEEIPEKYYLSAEACKGILRRKKELNQKMNSRLELLMTLKSKEVKI